MARTRPIEISVVSPVYNADDCLDELVRQIVLAVEPLTPHFEIVLVDDGSRDKSWAGIVALSRIDSRVRGLKLSRNFGQHNALTAGLAAARGEVVITLDCDLQDDPAHIPTLLNEYKKGFDIVHASKQVRQYDVIRNLGSKVFCWFFNTVVGSEYVRLRTDVGTYAVLSRRVVNAFLAAKEPHAYFVNVLGWLGFSRTLVPVPHSSRFAGKSGYSFGRLLRFAFDESVSQSDALLYGGAKFGAVISGAAVLGASLAYLSPGSLTMGSLIYFLFLSVTFVTGVIIGSIALVGIHLSKNLEKLKKRPHFVIQEEVNPASAMAQLRA